MNAGAVRFRPGRAGPRPNNHEPVADVYAPAQVTPEPVWPTWVQRCGTGSSCNCIRSRTRAARRRRLRAGSRPDGGTHRRSANAARDWDALQPAAGQSYGLARDQSHILGLAGRSDGARPPACRTGPCPLRIHDLGADLADVQVHTSNASHRAADSLHAEAFTVGSHIGFRAGRFAPGTAQGQKLLAHEMTHVLQQRGGGACTGTGAPVQRQPVPASPPEARRRPGHRR